MHLFVCLKMFEASWLTRALVVSAQVVLTPTLMLTYMIYPPAMHRFVGYLEETACHTYVSIIEQVQIPGTHLNLAWKNVPAPDFARGYWKLGDDAMFVDVLMCMVRTLHTDDCMLHVLSICVCYCSVCGRDSPPRCEPHICRYEARGHQPLRAQSS
jgi:hypothetical protein